MNYWESDKIKIRAVEPEDGIFFHEALLDTQIQRNISDIRFPLSKKACEDWSNEMAVNKNTDESFFIIENNTGNKVGMMDLHDLDQRVGTFSYGIWIKPEYQRKGYAVEAIKIMLKFFFEELRYQKVTINTYSYNSNSIKLHEKLGFINEGRIRRVVFTEGKHFDELIFGMTVEEYFDKYKSV